MGGSGNETVKSTTTDVTNDASLEALRWNWGDAYEIEITSDGGWRARRRNGLGGWMTAGNSDDLNRQIVDEYTVSL
jgi:hypothetical protein